MDTLHSRIEICKGTKSKGCNVCWLEQDEGCLSAYTTEEGQPTIVQFHDSPMNFWFIK